MNDDLMIAPPLPHAVTVYLSASRKVDVKYFTMAHDLGAAIARERWTLVYGGNYVGPMGALSDGARSERGRVVGVTPRMFNDGGLADANCDELILVDTMRERKRLMEQYGSAFVALPGGVGTLEEWFEVLVGRQLRFHDKPILLLSPDDFWRPLVAMLEQFAAHGFVRPETFTHFEVVSNVDEAIARLRILIAGATVAGAPPKV